MAICDWPEDERPRERLLQYGAASLSHAELLAIFLRHGRAGQSAVDVAREILQHIGGLKNLARTNIHDLEKISGIGLAKAAQLVATFELVRRALGDDLEEQNVFDAPEKVSAWLQVKIGLEEKECFMALWLNAQNHLLVEEVLFTGSLKESAVYPREVMKQALAHNAAAVIFAHNHPSNCLRPSTADLNITKTLKDTLALVDVAVLDHFIVTAHATLSFSEEGLI